MWTKINWHTLAGHCCAAAVDPSKLSGRIGRLDKGEGREISFRKMTIHPEYNVPNWQAENDICLLLPQGKLTTWAHNTRITVQNMY